MAFSLSDDEHTDECVWYFLNVFVDTILGTFICYGLLRFVNFMANKYMIKDLQSGLYYKMIERNGKKMARMILKKYFYQLGIWIVIVITVMNVLIIDEIYIVGFY